MLVKCSLLNSWLWFTTWEHLYIAVSCMFGQLHVSFVLCKSWRLLHPRHIQILLADSRCSMMNASAPTWLMRQPWSQVALPGCKKQHYHYSMSNNQSSALEAKAKMTLHGVFHRKSSVLHGKSHRSWKKNWCFP